MQPISGKSPRFLRIKDKRLGLFLLASTVLLIIGGLFVSIQVTRAASPYCQVTYTVTNQWPGGFGDNITVKNTGSSAWQNWSLAFAFPASGQTITQGWSGTFTQSGQNVTVTNMSWNGSVAVNGSVTPGFNGAWTASNPSPTSFSVNGNTCTSSTSGTPTSGTTPTPAPTNTPAGAPTATPTSVPTANPTSVPTVAPTAPPTSGAPTATPPATGTESNVDRYFPAGTAVSDMISGATSLSQQQVKVLIEQQVKEYWSVIQSTFGFTTLEQGYGFFLGMATRESTLQGGLETGGTTLGSGTAGSGSSGHSFGPLQAAETAYLNTNPNYQVENDVPQISQYDLVPQNFYDIGISIHMGIRHLIHFAQQAKAAGDTGVNIARYGLAGYNTGWVTNVSSDELTSYSDEIGALSGWYINNSHLYDTAWTWTGDSRVDRSNPWGWYA